MVAASDEKHVSLVVVDSLWYFVLLVLQFLVFFFTVFCSVCYVTRCLFLFFSAKLLVITLNSLLICA